jgi:MFS family permease
MQSVGQSWLVLQLTNSPLRLGLIGTLQFGPFLLLSIVSGAVVDRLPPRRLLIVTQISFAAHALMLALLVWTGHVAYWQIALLATVLGLTNTLDQPARQAFVVTLVGKADVINAVALNSAAFNAARIVGPGVAGLLIGQFGVAPAFFLNGLAFLIVALTLLSLREASGPIRRSGTTILADIGEGLAYARRTPRVCLFLSLLFAVNLTVFNFTVYVPLLTRMVLGLGPEGFGILMTALGVGAVTGALTLATRRSEGTSTAGVFAAAAFACGGLVGLGMADHLRTTVLLLGVTGFFGIMVIAGCNTALQLGIASSLGPRGRPPRPARSSSGSHLRSP